MADVQDSASLARDVAYFAQGLFLERRVANRQHFVDEDNLGLEMRRDREPQPHVHSARIMFDRSVDKLVHFGECHDLVELALDFVSPHPENRAAQKNILAPRQLGMKSSANLEQTSNSTVQVDPSCGRLRDPRHDLE